MKILIIISFISLLYVGCANEPVVRELESRANYEEKDDLEIELFSKRVYKGKKSAEIYIYPQKLSNGDLYKGGYVEAVIYDNEWVKKKTKKRRLKKRKKKSKIQMNSLHDSMIHASHRSERW